MFCELVVPKLAAAPKSTNLLDGVGLGSMSSLILVVISSPMFGSLVTDGGVLYWDIIKIVIVIN